MVKDDATRDQVLRSSRSRPPLGWLLGTAEGGGRADGRRDREWWWLVLHAKTRPGQPPGQAAGEINIEGRRERGGVGRWGLGVGMNGGEWADGTLLRTQWR